ncbi:MAG: hypothetical protein MHPSP_003114, partial [Paramarteilia canceri]
PAIKGKVFCFSNISYLTFFASQNRVSHLVIFPIFVSLNGNYLLDSSALVCLAAADQHFDSNLQKIGIFGKHQFNPEIVLNHESFVHSTYSQPK